MQNRSHAVMSQRVEAHDSLDFFPTPAWGTRAVCEWLSLYGSPHSWTCWEPACGQGHMVVPLREYFNQVCASDVHDYGFPGTIQSDFLFGAPETDADWIITNPPFRLAGLFADKAIERADKGVAILVRTAFLESAGRYRKLFLPRPPTDILQFVERLPMQKGTVNREGSTATAYCWLLWRKEIMPAPTRFHWLAPCRKRLERDSDYPSVGVPAS